MLKYGLIISLMTLSMACSDNHDRDSPSPAPLVTPTPAPVTPTGTPSPLTPTPPKLTARNVPVNELSDDFGFTATYAKVLFPMSAFPSSPSLVLVNKSRIQVRKENNREILDCRFTDGGFTDVKYVLDGKSQSPSAFLWINCMTLKSDVLPIQNIKDLCEVYGCTDETVNGESTTKVAMEPTLWIEKDSGIRIKDSSHTEMLEMTAGAPDEADFAYTAVD